MTLDMLSAFNEATKEADAFENHPISSLNLEDKMLYLQGLAMVMNADGEIHATEKEYCRILIKSFGMDVSVLDDVISFVQAPDGDTIQAFVRCYRRNTLAQVFLFDALMMTRRDGKVHDKEMPLVNAIADQLEILKGTQQDIFDHFCHIKNRNWQESALYFSSHLLNPEHFKHLLAYHEISFEALMQEIQNIGKSRLLSHIEERVGFSIKPNILRNKKRNVIRPQDDALSDMGLAAFFRASRMPKAAIKYDISDKEMNTINIQREATCIALLSPEVIMPFLQSKLNRREIKIRGSVVFKINDEQEEVYCNLDDLGLVYNKEHESLFDDKAKSPKYSGTEIPKDVLNDLFDLIF